MERLTGFKHPNDIAVLNKLLSKLDRDKADVRCMYQNRIAPKTSACTLNIDEVVIRCTGTFTVTLPKSSGSAKIYWIKNISTGTITIAVAPGSGDLIDGLGTNTIAAKVSRQLIDSTKGYWDVL